MELVPLLKSVSEFGTAPALLVVGAILAMLFRRLGEVEAARKKDGDALRNEIDALRKSQATSLTEAIATIERHQDDQHKEHEKALAEVECRLGYVERDYVSRDEHYRDFSGWRDEIRALGQRINDLILAVFQGKQGGC